MAPFLMDNPENKELSTGIYNMFFPDFPCHFSRTGIAKTPPSFRCTHLACTVL